MATRHGFLNRTHRGHPRRDEVGMLAAEAAYDALAAERSQDELSAYPELLQGQLAPRRLHKTRNFKPYA